MYSTVGFVVFLTACLPYATALKVALAIPSTVFCLWLSLLTTCKDDDPDEPMSLPTGHFSINTSFFRTRYDFINRGFELTGQSIYKFKLLRKTVVVVSGAPGRADLFNSRDLDLTAGFKALSGAIPMLPGVTTDLDPKHTATIHRRLATAQNSDHLERLIPKLLFDSCRILESWGESGVLDPFTKLPELTFQTNVRSLACAEIADNAATVAHLKQLYDTLDAATTPTSVLFPWLPSPSAIRRLLATKKIYDVISAAVDVRSQCGPAQDDTLQLLLDSGDDKMTIVGFTMGLLIAGARSTGTTSSWLITFLAGHRQWKDRTARELHQLLAEHAPSTAPSTPRAPAHTARSPSPPPLADVAARLAALPLAAWEAHTPVLDAVLRETLRLAQPHTALRQNLSAAPVRVGGVAVPPGAFAVFPFSDVHLSAALYPDPWRFDPARPARTMPFAFVGWGAGRTVCLGQRLARVQLKLVTALVVLGFDLAPVDRAGRELAELPRPNWNDALACRPADGSCFLRYERA